MSDRELIYRSLDLLQQINELSRPPFNTPLPAEIDDLMDELQDRLDNFTSYEISITAFVDAEREECAKLADAQMYNTAALLSSPPKSSAAWNIAAAIRARSKA